MPHSIFTLIFALNFLYSLPAMAADASPYSSGTSAISVTIPYRVEQVKDSLALEINKELTSSFYVEKDERISKTKTFESDRADNSDQITKITTEMFYPL